VGETGVNEVSETLDKDVKLLFLGVGCNGKNGG